MMSTHKNIFVDRYGREFKIRHKEVKKVERVR